MKNIDEQDVIEGVASRPTFWLSELVIVIVPKPGNNICLCIDMRNADTAI